MTPLHPRTLRRPTPHRHAPRRHAPYGVLVVFFVLASAAAIATSAAFAQDEPSGGAMQGGMRRRVVHDPAFFRANVLPLLERNCIGCHDADDPDNRTRHRLVPPGPDGAFSDAAVQANYESITQLVHAPAPERSLLLLKLVPLARGGIDHDGGKADGRDFAPALIDAKGPLVQWVFGADARNAAPVAVLAPWPTTVPRGTELSLDAALSFDADGDDVSIEWEIVEKPLGAEARLSQRSGATTSITPDRDGPWLLRCRPRDGKLSGWPVLVRFAATRPVERAPGDDDRPLPALRLSSTQRRLTRALYFDLLGRSPTREEIARVAAMPYPERVDRLLGSLETWEHWFDEEAFFFLLIDRFRPVSDRLAAVPTKMRDDLLTFRDAHRAFALSAEFNARNPGNDTYVTVVLEQFLSIEVQSEKRLLKEAKRMYDGQKTRIFKQLGTSQSDVVRIALEQPGYVDNFARRMEQRYLGAPLPADEHAAVVSRLTLDPSEFRPLMREWLTSERYTSPGRAPRVKDDHQFIRGLFVDLLGRPPALQEFRNMRNALQALTDAAPLRGVLAKVMLDSGAVIPPAGARDAADARTSDSAAGAVTSEEILDLFHRLLGRDPTPDELSAFLTVLAEPGATWRTAALALLTSPHYQYY